MLDANERRLLLGNALVHGGLARMGRDGLSAAEAEVRHRLTRQVFDEGLLAVERALNETLARLPASAMATLFAEAHEFEVKQLRDFFAPILSQLEAELPPGVADAALLRAWQWERGGVAPALRGERRARLRRLPAEAALPQARPRGAAPVEP
ncbi:MAG: hypothetical protein INH41_25355 [Myxococcaceae bacterium]|jgi:hypothetical protein|nr:hypothetical protein [Myxococcaceae bacterium]MCA3015727.1 hypothetical protein [Myxococcaceae bacterium]